MNTKKKPQEKTEKREKVINKAVVDFHINYRTITESARPVDFSYQQREKTGPCTPEQARTTRLGILQKGPKKRLLTKGLWLNNNKLKTLEGINEFVSGVLEFPDKLELLDLSCNELKTIHEDLLRNKNIKILYLHGNQIEDAREILKLKKLTQLRGLTIYGNPICERKDLGSIRKLVVDYLPTLEKLDFNKYTNLERCAPIDSNANKLLREVEGEKGDWLFEKFKKYPKGNKEQVDARCDKLQEMKENEGK